MNSSNLDMNEDPILKWFRSIKISTTKPPVRVSIFDCPENVLSLACRSQSLKQNSTEEVIVDQAFNKFTCRLCDEIFHNVHDQRAHFKSDSHIAKLRGNNEEDDNLSVKDDSENDSDDSDIIGSDEEIEIDSNELVHGQYNVISYCGHTVRREILNGHINYIFTNLQSSWQFAVSSSLLIIPRHVFEISQESSPSHPNANDSKESSPLILPWRQLSTLLTKDCNLHTYSCIIVLQSGKFVIVLFENTTPVASKSIKRYTVRAKAGGSQSSHDNSKHKAKSAGSTLRRYGEQALREDILNILKQYQGLIQKCSFILYHVSKRLLSNVFAHYGTASSTVNSKEAILIPHDDPRLRKIPMMIGTVTVENVKACFTRCTTVEFSLVSQPTSSERNGEIPSENTIAKELSTDSMVDTSKIFPLPTDTVKSTKGGEKGGEKGGGDETDEVAIRREHLQNSYEPFMQLVNAINEEDVTKVSNALHQLRISSTFTIPTIHERSVRGKEAGGVNDHDQDEDGGDDEAYACAAAEANRIPSSVIDYPISLETLLRPVHVAAMNGLPKILSLLLESGASPCLVDARGRYPYYLAKDKTTRDAFRRYR